MTIIAEAIESGNDRFLKISVQDTGIGISEENQKNLFKFFGFLKENTETNKNGVGLGLVIAKMIVQQFDGDISCTSEEGKGSTFSFTIKLEPIEEGMDMVSMPGTNQKVNLYGSDSQKLIFKWRPKENQGPLKYVLDLNDRRIMKKRMTLKISDLLV